MNFSENINLDQLNAMSHNTVAEALGIEFIDLGKDFIVARMPVDHRTHQPAGMLHGGASVVLAETLGSVAGSLHVDRQTQAVVGLEINANHLRAVRSGWVYGWVTAIHLGRSTQVWEIRIKTEDDKLVCISRLTLAVIQKGAERPPMANS